MDPTLNSLNNIQKTQAKQLAGIENRMTDLENKTNIFLTKSDIQNSLNEMTDAIAATNTAINEIEQKLNKIKLPEDTRFFLKESEVSDFRINFRKLRTMMSELERTRQAFIRLAARFNLTNSQA